jgi:hypothetical protein
MIAQHRVTRWALALAACTAVPATVGLVQASAAQASPEQSAVYNAVPSPLPPNVPSLGFEATSTTEFGDFPNLAGRARTLDTVTVTMSDWALHSDYPTMSSKNWKWPVTVNVYRAGPVVGGLNTVGAKLGTLTENLTIPWRPPASPSCGKAWMAADGQCFNGIAFNARFDMSGLHVKLPDTVVVGVAYNTADYGAAPTHAPGPYNSLNVGVPTNDPVTAGSDVSADNVFWNTSFAGFYADGGVAGVGILREDTNWTPNGTVALKITTSGRTDGHRGHGHEGHGNGHRDRREHVGHE